MLSSITPLHLLGPETQGTLSSINEEDVPVGLVFVKPNYIRSVERVGIIFRIPSGCVGCNVQWHILKIPHSSAISEQKHCDVVVYILTYCKQVDLLSTIPYAP